METYGKRNATSPKENMAKHLKARSSVSVSHEADLDTIVKVEFETINGKPFLGQISDDELVYLWVKVFNRKKEELFGVTSTKTLTRNVRATFKLNSPTKLSEIFEAGNFSYERCHEDGSQLVIVGKIIGFGAQKPAEIGDVVQVTVRTNFLVEASGVLNWLKLFGTISANKGGFQTSTVTGLKSDIYEVELKLKTHINEYLPMYGQKAQVFYPGIPRVCNRCYVPGHLRRDCQNIKKDWLAYVVELLDGGLDPELIGKWQGAAQRWREAHKGK
jgi:hypothetical protein